MNSGSQIVGFTNWGQEYGLVKDLDSGQNLAQGKFLFRLIVSGLNDQMLVWILLVACCP